MMMVEEGPFSNVILQRPRRLQQHQQVSPDTDLGNFTIEHVDNAGSEENPENMLLIEEKSRQLSVLAEDDILTIGIEANDLNSLLEQFEETEATLKNAADCQIATQDPPPNVNPSVTSINANSPLKNVKKPPPKKDVDPAEVVKKIAPAKRKSAILLEPQSMPVKRIRGKVVSQTAGSERGCHSLPGSRSTSPIPRPSSKLEAKLPGFNYLNLEHDYCTGKSGSKNNNTEEEKKEIEALAQENIEQIKNAKSARANKAKDPVAAKAAANERKQLYKKRQYRLRKKGSNTETPEGSEQGDSNQPTPMTSPNRDEGSSGTPSATSPNTSPTRSSSFVTPNASPSVSKTTPQSSNAVQERRLHYFDKIPDYFPTKLFSMYQEIGSTDQTEKDEKEKEPTVSDTNSYSRAGEAGSDTSFSHTVNTDASFSHTVNTAFTSPTYTTGTNQYDSSCALSEPPEADDQDVHVEEENVDRPTSRASSCSRKASPSVRSRRRSWRYSDSRASRSRSCSTCSSRSRSRSYSRTPSPDGSQRRRYSSYSSYSSRSWSSRSRSCSRSYSRSRSRSSSRSRNSRSPSIPRSRSSRRASSHYSSVHSPSPQRSSSVRQGRKRLRRKRRRRYSHRSGSGYSSRRRSRTRSRSPIRSRSRSRSRSRRPSRRSLRRQRRERRLRRNSDRRNESRKQEREWKKQRWDETMEEQKKQWEDRRVIYVGRIADDCTKDYLGRRFGRFGEIDKITVHFRDEGDNYAFVTFHYTCDAFAAIEGVNHDYHEPEYDVCFGGRRQFCRTNYADLDSMNQEEMAMEFGYEDNGEVHKADEPVTQETDFDKLLKQAMKNAKKR